MDVHCSCEAKLANSFNWPAGYNFLASDDNLLVYWRWPLKQLISGL
jgi:hypothetical protein